MIDWSLQPEWAKYAALSSDGDVWIFSEIPKIQGEYWRMESGKLDLARLPTNKKSTDWMNTLTKRPEEK